MKKLFGVTYLDREELKQNQINYPIRLEYYEIEEQEKYGLEVIKTEYRPEELKIENTILKEVTEEYTVIGNILEKFKEGGVTPGLAEEMAEEVRKSLNS